MRLLDLMEPEETVGNLWHEMAREIGAPVHHPDAAAHLGDLRASLAVLFRALGGRAGVELVEAVPSPVRHRTSARRKLGSGQDCEYVASFDGERLRLPPFIATFTASDLNRAAYFWLTALAAVAPRSALDLPDPDRGALAFDCAQITRNAEAAALAHVVCAGLRSDHAEMRALCLDGRPEMRKAGAAGAIERAIHDHLAGVPVAAVALPDVAERGYMPFAPVPIWLQFRARASGDGAADAAEPTAPPPLAATTTKKLGLRKDRDEANRKDSFIIHRFESILSWVESMNLNRSVDDDDDENAQKAAEDQDNITLSRHDRRAATRLRLHLDLSPSDADHEKLAGTHVYPEWNHRSRSYMEGHCRVLDAPARPDPASDYTPDPRRMRDVRRQFEALRPRRILRPRQIDGSELDLDAVIAARADLAATGQSSDRIYRSARQIERDLAVAFLIDTSRSTEAALGETTVLDIARDALTALAGGIDAAGDQLGIWGFSSLRRDRVFVTCCKSFETEMGPEVIDNIAALRPGHYTRLGAAIRHTSAMLAQTQAARKLLIVLTDGKPNDLDHYEGQHGIEDSHMAVSEALRAGQALHGVILDEDGQDWFARIFGRGGFSLLPNPERLGRALPDIYRNLTQEN